MILIKQVTVVSPGDKYNKKKVDILFDKGKIASIGSRITHDTARKIQIKGLHISPGWIDVGTQIGDPGYEHREDIQSINQVAQAGGYTGLINMPNTEPITHSKSEILYLKNTSKGLPVNIHPLGAISRGCNGNEISELYDMHAAGAVGFSDGKKSIQHNGLMMRALQYVKTFDGIVVNQPNDESLSNDGQINEGAISTLLGMKGNPSMSEEMMIKRDIELLKYTDSKLHIYNVSTAVGVDLIRAAKDEKLKVSASTSAFHLAYSEEQLRSFDSNYKLVPPLRKSSDQAALLKGVKDGTIDIITSGHMPVEKELKDVEFPYSEYGAINLQTCFSLLRTSIKNRLSLNSLIIAIAINPRKIFNLEIPRFEENSKADFTLFLPNDEWDYNSKNNLSKSSNSPLLNNNLMGCVVGLMNNGKTIIH